MSKQEFILNHQIGVLGKGACDLPQLTLPRSGQQSPEKNENLYYITPNPLQTDTLFLMIPTLEWTHDGVRFLDQTKLPLEETYLLATTP